MAGDTCTDAFGSLLTIGDTVVFIASPHALQRGIVTGSKSNKFGTTLDVLVNDSMVMQVVPGLAVRVGG